eukprot:gene23033-27376_t
MTRTAFPPRVRRSCHRSCQTPVRLCGLLGRIRHGLLTKYVDVCRTSVALVGDYSPRTERILPRQNPFGKPSFGKRSQPRL